MDRKKLLLAVAALLFAGIAAYGVNMLMRNAATPTAQAAAAPKMDGPMIMVATRPLPVGTIINPEMIRFQPWPKDLIDGAYFLKDSADITSLSGAVVRTAITAGQPVTQGSLVKPGERGFLAAALSPGMRAVTIPVSSDSGVAGFIFPGDRVDLVLQSGWTGDADDKEFKVAETFVRNVRVLATDQRTDSKNAEGKDEVQIYALVTLEATPKIAEKIAVAQSLGKISLSLRSIADTQAELEKAIAQGEISLPPGTDAKGEREIITQMASRPIDRGTTMTPGSQVSRFSPSRPSASGLAAAVQKAQQEVIIEKIKESGTALKAGATTNAQGQIVNKPIGPVVRVVRGDKVTEQPVGGN